ncbi:MAG: SurA N-terminal domain-containing protein [Gammaproteobacteria bacterium]
MAIRDRVMGFVGWLLLGLLFIAFAFFGLNSYFTSNAKIYAADVNGVEITIPEYQRAYQQMRSRMQRMMGEAYNPAMIDEDALKKSALQQLIREQLILQEAGDDGYAVSKQLVAAQINAVPAFNGEDGTFSVEKYRQVLQLQGMAPAEFEWRLSRELMVNQVTNGIALTVGVSRQDLERIYRLQTQQRRFSYLELPLQQSAAEVKVSDSDIETYYTENSSDFMSPEHVKIQYLELKADELQVSDVPDDQALHALYDEHSDRYVTPEERQARHILVSVSPDAGEDAERMAREKAESLLARLEKGEAFEELAKESSDDPGSASKGGDLGFFSRGVMTQEFETAAFALKKGGRSGIVKSPFGFHIIEVTDIKPQHTKPFDEVRDELVKEYQVKERGDLFSDRAETLANLTFEQPDSLQGAANALGLEIKTSDWLTKEGGPGIGQNETVVDAAFQEDVLEAGNNSEPVELGNNHLVVLRILEHQPAEKQLLESVKDKVTAEVRDAKARELARTRGDSLLKELRSGTPLADIASAQQLKVKTTGLIGRNATDPAPRIVTEAFMLPPAADKGRSTTGFSLDSGDYVLLVLDEVKDGDFSSLSQDDQLKVRQELDRIIGGAEVNAFTDELKNHAEIIIPEQSN